MNQNSPENAVDVRNGPVEDSLDRVLSDFFKAQMKNPWPAVPATIVSEPSVLVAARNASADAPRNQPSATSPPAARDSGSKARYTLAASVALLLGTCWYLSNGFQPTERPRTGPSNTPSGPGLFEKGTAGNPAALEELRKDNATGGNGIVRPKIDLNGTKMP
jgi:hypothetical protein